MKLRVTGALAASLLLAACAGKYDGDKMAQGDAIPGSSEDFQQRVNNFAYFDFDSSSLTDGARQNLSSVANWSREYPEKPLIVEGHADQRGTREYNLALGERRANSAKKFLVAQGATGGNGDQHIRTVSYGKNRLPGGSGTDEVSNQKNRVAIVKVD